MVAHRARRRAGLAEPMRRLSAAQIGAAADAALDSSGESSGAEEEDEFGLPRRRAGPIVRSVSSELLDESRGEGARLTIAAALRIT